MATRLEQLYKTNLPPLETQTKNFTTKMVDSEFWNKNKKLKAKLVTERI